MRSIFLSLEQLFEKTLPEFEKVGAAAPATDLALLTAQDDGFLHESGGGINYYLADGCVDRFGRPGTCAVCAVRPALLLDAGEEKELHHLRTEGGVTTAEYGSFPAVILDASLREMAAREFARGSLPETGRRVRVGGETLPVLRLGAKEIVRVTLAQGGVNGYVRLSDGTLAGEGESVFLELRPVRWLYDEQLALLVSCQALFGGMSREEAAEYLRGDFLNELRDGAEGGAESASFRVEEHDELGLIRAYVEANIPVFLHGLSGDGNDEIVDIKPVWLVKLERLCEDGQLHILFFDELTNATKQTQSVIFKIVLERFVNNRWPLPENARIVAAGNDRSESSAAHDLAEPLFGRFAHIYIRTTVENWMPWAVRKQLNPYVMEFLANNDLYLRTAYTGTEPNADPRRWEMASRVLDSSGNDFSLLAPVVGRDAAEALIGFFRAQQTIAAIANYTDEELSRFSIPRRYQLAQQCLYFSAENETEARTLVRRLGAEYEAWFRYMLERKKKAGL